MPAGAPRHQRSRLPVGCHEPRQPPVNRVTHVNAFRLGSSTRFHNAIWEQDFGFQMMARHRLSDAELPGALHHALAAGLAAALRVGLTRRAARCATPACGTSTRGLRGRRGTASTRRRISRRSIARARRLSPRAGVRLHRPRPDPALRRRVGAVARPLPGRRGTACPTRRIRPSSTPT
jgi:hypothetical protein